MPTFAMAIAQQSADTFWSRLGDSIVEAPGSAVVAGGILLIVCGYACYKLAVALWHRFKS